MIHPTYPYTWLKRGWISQSCLPPLPLATEAMQTLTWTRDLASGQVPLGKVKPFVCWLRGQTPPSSQEPPWGHWAWVSPLTKEEVEGAEPPKRRLMCVPVTHWANSLHVWGTELDPEMKNKVSLRVFPRESISYTGAEGTSGCRQSSTALLVNTGKQAPNC